MKRGWMGPTVVLLLAACSSAARPSAQTIPTPPTCANLDAAWAEADWPRVLNTLDGLEANGLACGPEPLAAKRYSALINYAAALEAAGLTSPAIEQYQHALEVNGRGREAVNALKRLNALPAPTAAACAESEPLPAYTPTSAAAPVTLRAQSFDLDGQPWQARGVNYYPAAAPWDRFLTNLDLAQVEADWKLISAAGFNTVRIFLWHDPLFTCEPETATPLAPAFAQIDGLMALAGKYGLRLIITLHDLPDLDFRPLYTDWARYDAQAAFIIARYRAEPVILAWDLRNEGDLDYGASGYHTVYVSRAEVLGWLAHAAQVARSQSPTQLLTAGWWGDALETLPAVDFPSFHHWGSAASLAGRLAEAREAGLPVLVEEIGYHSWEAEPSNPHDEARQAELLGQALEVIESSGAAGWVIWAAFDFTPGAGQAEGYEHHFGLWRADGTPKPALETAQTYLNTNP